MTTPVCIDTISTKTSRFATFRAAVAAIGADVGACWRILEDWRERGRQRRMLAGLDPTMLKDIGVSEADAWAEATKPWWRR